MLFLRVYQHLLPRATAWSLTAQKTLRSFFTGLSGAPSDVRDFVDDVYGDISPETTRELVEWEKQFGLLPVGTDDDRRASLTAAWASTGGQAPGYIQSVLRAAGFDVYVHEWWTGETSEECACGEELAECGEQQAFCGSEGGPRVRRDPRTYTEYPLVGDTQCGDDAAQCGEPLAFCDNMLTNEVGYLVNSNLTRRAPLPVTGNPEKWPYFVYVGGETFPDRAIVAVGRRSEFERKLLSVVPPHLWIVLLVDYEYPVVDAYGNQIVDSYGNLVYAHG